MELRPGDVVRIWDRSTTPEKVKRHICVCPEAQLFLRINSKAYWPPYHVLYADECDFLDHDSYVELQQLWHHVRSEVRSVEIIGRLTSRQTDALCESAAAAPTLNANQRDLIRDRLAPTDGA
ncbi:hypothetical protein [Chenggangzhangella methanolivorans]|uniref:Uncharacterized protein n=1 Tax=Chenggangzhangella methanolivorans TaxID=1437009 RepID=A0A9E6R7N7_9HYPH|nr:hypothetical protein [Chenggangzhangella methanolivorans]QZN98373.1 hypothetical protein K6K41_14780 [Chenggangzhangella methanolivorans]